jgi:Conserved hypothetical protein (DUF2461)
MRLKTQQGSVLMIPSLLPTALVTPVICQASRCTRCHGFPIKKYQIAGPVLLESSLLNCQAWEMISIRMCPRPARHPWEGERVAPTLSLPSGQPVAVPSHHCQNLLLSQVSSAQLQQLFAKYHMQGYEADNPNIEFLRLKNFAIRKQLKDDEVVGPGCLERIAGLVGTMAPFVSPHPFCTAFSFV